MIFNQYCSASSFIPWMTADLCLNFRKSRASDCGLECPITDRVVWTGRKQHIHLHQENSIAAPCRTERTLRHSSLSSSQSNDWRCPHGRLSNKVNSRIGRALCKGLVGPRDAFWSLSRAPTPQTNCAMLPSSLSSPSHPFESLLLVMPII